MQTNRVLLAHSDPVVQELAVRAITRLGVTLDIAAGSGEALTRLASDAYSVIVVQRDEALLSALVASDHRPRPVVVVTAETSEGLDPGIVSLFVPEPYDPHTLVGVILACVTPGNVPIDGPLPGDLTDNL